MRWSYNLAKSHATAIWLFGMAALVFLMILVGGATRLTGSGLSITEWRPVTGIIPPMSVAGWAHEFLQYQHIPQYQLVNRGMSLGEFKSLFWWEWAHRLIGRLVGVAFIVPFVVLLALRRIPRRLIWRCVVILGLGMLQGLVGWWMVASGLAGRISVAPERLAVHLVLALLILMASVWTGLEAWFGRPRSSASGDRAWGRASIGIVVLTLLQITLGALVAGNQAGKVYTDWPLMAGHIFPVDYARTGEGVWTVLAHSPAAVQFNHRIVGYVLFFAVLAFFVTAAKSRISMSAKQLSLGLAAAVTLQALVGVLTLKMAAPLPLALVHQFGAACVLTLALILAWRIQREQ